MVENNILDDIQSIVGPENISNSCKESGCEAYMTDVPHPRLLIDLQSVYSRRRDSSPQTRCDFALFFLHPESEQLLTAAIELKNTRPDASKIIDQLNGGAKYIESIIAPLSLSYAPDCQPIVFHGQGIHKDQKRKIDKGRISFMGERLIITTARCNSPRNLANAIAELIGGIP